jgi:hypothetical protein
MEKEMKMINVSLREILKQKTRKKVESVDEVLKNIDEKNPDIDELCNCNLKISDILKVQNSMFKKPKSDDEILENIKEKSVDVDEFCDPNPVIKEEKIDKETASAYWFDESSLNENVTEEEVLEETKEMEKDVKFNDGELIGEKKEPKMPTDGFIESPEMLKEMKKRGRHKKDKGEKKED